MVKTSSIIGLIMLGSMIATSKTMAMLEQEDIQRANTIIRAQRERQQEIDNIN